MGLYDKVKPPSPTKALASRFPQHDRAEGIYSNSNRITFHKQLCFLWFGDPQVFDLKGYTKNGKQYGHTLGKHKKHFVRQAGVWHRVK